MGHPVRLTFPMKSLEQLRVRLGVSVARQEELLDILGVRPELLLRTQSVLQERQPRSALLLGSGRPVVQRPRVDTDAVFLNVPYDAKFERLYLAYIVGLLSLDLVPKVTLGIPSG